MFLFGISNLPQFQKIKENEKSQQLASIHYSLGCLSMSHVIQGLTKNWGLITLSKNMYKIWNQARFKSLRLYLNVGLQRLHIIHIHLKNFFSAKPTSAYILLWFLCSGIKPNGDEGTIKMLRTEFVLVSYLLYYCSSHVQ